MKRNLFLLVILSALISITWWFQERGGEIDRAEQEKKELIFDPKEFGGLVSMHFGDVDLYAQDDKFLVGDERIAANPFKIEEMFEALNSLAVVRKLSEKEAQALNANLAFRSQSPIKIFFKTMKRDINFLIGSKLATHSSRFYGKLGDTVLILEDRRPLLEAYNPDDEGDLKQERLRSIFTINPEFFYDTRVFINPIKVAKATFDNPRVRKSVITDFVKKSTTPKPIAGLGYDLEEFNRWASTFEALEAHHIFPKYDAKLLKDLRAQVKVIDAQGSKIDLSLFSGYGSLPGDFVISSESHYLFELGHNHAGIFFQNVQDFWDISFLKPSESLSLFFKSEEKQIELKVLPGQQFEVEMISPLDLEPRRDRLAVFYSLLMTRARYVTDLIDLDYKQHFVLKADKRTVVFGEVPSQWVIVDSVNKLAYYYNKHDFPDLPSELDQYFGSK
tara:strand:- start:246 stop:1583 length:1338 start_codon:yes stop_codon:yes gene_type:complete